MPAIWRDETSVSDLLSSVAEQLKLPLSNIARRAELAQLDGAIEPADIDIIYTQVQSAINLVDSYMLGIELLKNQEELIVEPVSVSSVVTDVAHALYSYAKQYGVIIELEVQGRFEPVISNNAGLRAALISLGYELIQNQAANTDSSHLTFAVFRNSKGVLTGMYSDYEELQAEQWKKALEIYGKAKRPFSSLTSNSGAGIFVADTILKSMSSKLKVSKFKNQRGLACVFPPSQQLQFI